MFIKLCFRALNSQVTETQIPVLPFGSIDLEVVTKTLLLLHLY